MSNKSQIFNRHIVCERMFYNLTNFVHMMEEVRKNQYLNTCHLPGMPVMSSTYIAHLITLQTCCLIRLKYFAYVTTVDLNLDLPCFKVIDQVTYLLQKLQILKTGLKRSFGYYFLILVPTHLALALYF